MIPLCLPCSVSGNLESVNLIFSSDSGVNSNSSVLAGLAAVGKCLK